MKASSLPFSRLGTIFYLAYLIFEYPQNLALQRFPVGKWMRCVRFGAFSTRARTRSGAKLVVD